MNGEAVFRRRFDYAHVAQADQRHIERARDGRRGKRQNIDVELQFLQAFLVRDAEALLFIHNQEPEVVKLDVLGKQAVRADDDVHLPRLDAGQDDLSARARCGNG